MLCISKGIEYRILFTKVLLEWKSKRETYECCRSKMEKQILSPRRGSCLGRFFHYKCQNCQRSDIATRVSGIPCCHKCQHLHPVSKYKPETLLPPLLISQQCLLLVKYNGSRAGRRNGISQSGITEQNVESQLQD